MQHFNNEDDPIISIGIPSTGTIRVETMISIIGMLFKTPARYDVYTPMSCYVHQNREECVKHAQSIKADYLLFIDTDMKFPEDALQKLLDQDKDIIAGAYNRREFPISSALIPLNEENFKPGDKLTYPPDAFKVKVAATGFMLIKMHVFDKLPRPWFFFGPETSTSQIIGEDVWFCIEAQKYGFDVWADPNIKIGHIGAVTF